MSRNKGQGQLAKDRPFGYGRILRLDYEDPDSETLVVLVDVQREFASCGCVKTY